MPAQDRLATRGTPSVCLWGGFTVVLCLGRGVQGQWLLTMPLPHSLPPGPLLMMSCCTLPAVSAPCSITAYVPPQQYWPTVHNLLQEAQQRRQAAAAARKAAEAEARQKSRATAAAAGRGRKQQRQQEGGGVWRRSSQVA